MKCLESPEGLGFSFCLRRSSSCLPAVFGGLGAAEASSPLCFREGVLRLEKTKWLGPQIYLAGFDHLLDGFFDFVHSLAREPQLFGDHRRLDGLVVGVVDVFENFGA